MARILWTGTIAVLLGWLGGDPACGQAPAPAAKPKVTLTARAQLGDTTLVTRTLKAEGKIRASTGDPESGAKPSPPMDLKVDALLEYHQRVAAAEDSGAVARAVRRVRKASATINGQVRPSQTILRPQVATLIAEARDRSVFLYSDGGPLTRQELDVLRGPGDPVAWVDLLPAGAVAVGDSWKVGEATARELADYDALAAHDLKAVLESVDDAKAMIRFRGTIHGVARGGEGKVACSAAVTFDRKAGRIRKLVVNRNEVRAAGPVETALEIKSTLTVDIQTAEPPGDLANAMLAALPAKPPKDWEQLLYVSPGGKFTLRHDRDWHLFWDDPKLTVLKRLALGQLVAQCNMAVGPNAGAGRHQDLRQFTDDVRKALGARFVRAIGQGEIDGARSDAFLFKLAVEGKQDTVGILWDYYLAASPRGDQLLVTFTLGKAAAEAFANQDEILMKSLEWTEAPKTTAPAAPKSAQTPAPKKAARSN